jgi:hypothetical protein
LEVGKLGSVKVKNYLMIAYSKGTTTYNSDWGWGNVWGVREKKMGTKKWIKRGSGGKNLWRI